MIISRKKELIFLIIGDIIVLFVSLALMLAIRFGVNLDQQMIENHTPPFLFLFALSIVLFYIAGLYEKHTVLFIKKLPALIINAQIVNAIVAIALFYFAPQLIITPKVSLFIYLIISSALMILWRLGGVYLFKSKKKYAAVIVGDGPEVKELVDELNNNSRYEMYVAEIINPVSSDVQLADIRKRIPDLSLMVIDGGHPGLQKRFTELFQMIFEGVRFVDVRDLYEDVFNRIPLSLMSEQWFIEHTSNQQKPIYDAAKRVADIVVSVPLAVISLIVYPFVWVGTKISDGGPVFFTHERVGRGGKIFKIWKFRSMSNNKITKFGLFLRKSRIDELPQLWSVVKGDQSLVGPRPEIPEHVKKYSEEIPYYNVRHIIPPGLSGWAQIYHDNHPHPHLHGLANTQTAEKLSYDLYYIKHRSPQIDVAIALKTLKILLSFVGK